MVQNISSSITFNRSQNYGSEYPTETDWMKDVWANTSSEKTLCYLSAKAVLSACMRIGGFINMVGCKVDPQWIHMNKEATPIKERLLRIYEKLNLPLTLDQGIWADVLLLFYLREKLSCFDLERIYGMPEADVPQSFKAIEPRFPIYRTHSIAGEAIQLLLNLSSNAG